MMRPRSIVLCQPAETTNPYARELAARGYTVECYSDTDALYAAMIRNKDEIRLVVLDALQADERIAIVNRLLLIARYNSPMFVWLTEPTTSVWVPDIFTGTYREGGATHAVRFVWRGNITEFSSRLSFAEDWLKLFDEPIITIQHTRRALLLDRQDAIPYREWLARHGCDPFEAVADVRVRAMSLRQAGRTLKDPLRRTDLYFFDRLAQAGSPMSLDDLLRSLTDSDSYVFAIRLATYMPDGFSRDSGKNALKRLRGALTLCGLDAHRTLRRDEDAYFIDRSVVRIEVEHLKE
jgi:hypothetical protein